MKRIGLALCACVALAGCETSPEDNLLGTWECATTVEGADIEGDTTYAKGGRLSGSFNMSMTDQGAEIEMSGTMSGSWEVDGDQLTEDVDKVTIVSATVNGQSIEDAPIVERFERSLRGQVSTSEIKLLDDEDLIVEESGTTTTCER